MNPIHQRMAHTGIGYAGIAGDAAFVTGEDGEKTFANPWNGALQSFLQPAMALGAPELLSEADRAILLEAWNHCFGR